jgi:hypothetical protein
MIYTFKVLGPRSDGEPLEVTHCAHGSDVLGQARELIDNHPGCEGVEVLMLGSRLFFLPRMTPADCA